jgi:hypothetical protein
MNQFLSADPAGLGRPDVPSSPDAVEEKLAGGTPEELKTALIRMLGEDLVRHRISDLVRYASDASPYRYIPSVIVQPKSIDHIAALLRYCIHKSHHATLGKDRLNPVTIIDSIAWRNDLLPSLTIYKTISKILVHPTCSTTHLGLSETLLNIAGTLAGSAEIPLGTTCCGTAGDRGLLHPELVHSATRDTLVEIQSSGGDTCFVSANRTCELGMRQTTGRVYESFIYALEEATRS